MLRKGRNLSFSKNFANESESRAAQFLDQAARFLDQAVRFLDQAAQFLDQAIGSAVLDQESRSHAPLRVQRSALSMSIPFCESDTRFLSNEKGTAGRRSLEKQAGSNLACEFPFKCYLSRGKIDVTICAHKYLPGRTKQVEKQ
jgi:hypothetical protein